MVAAIRIVPLPFCLVEWKCLLDDLHVNGEIERTHGSLCLCVCSISYQLYEGIEFLILLVSSFFLQFVFTHMCAYMKCVDVAAVVVVQTTSRLSIFYGCVVCKLWIIYMQISMICLGENDAYKITFWLRGKQTHFTQIVNFSNHISSMVRNGLGMIAT